MTNSDSVYEPHLDLCALSLLPGSEWTPRPAGWSLCQVDSGAGYWLHPRSNQELLPGTVIVQAGQTQGTIRSSLLGSLSLFFFYVEPGRLTGLLSLGEQVFLETAPVAGKPRVVPPGDPIAASMTALCADRSQPGCVFRLKLLQLFLEAFEIDWKQQVPRPQSGSGAKDRLRGLMDGTPASDLLHMSVAELSVRMGCSPRHVSRTFREVIGLSFREKQAELRLVRARELLVTTNSKVVDVALESGFQSLSLFNLMFRRRFGVSPGKWREGRRINKNPKGVQSFSSLAQRSPRFKPREGVSREGLEMPPVPGPGERKVGFTMH
jgi:AraC-like DNA-binding protein